MASFISPLLDREGEIANFLSVRFDITDQKRFEHQLIEAQSISQIGSWYYDLASLKLTWSTQQYHIFSLDKDSPIDDLFKFYMDHVHPDDHEVLAYLTDRAINQGEDFVYDHRLVFDGGNRVKYVQAIAKVTKDGSGKPVTMSGTCQDITERVTREAEYRMILDSVGMGVWKIDGATEKVEWDPSMYKLFELNEADFTNDRDAWRSCLLPHQADKLEDGLRSALRYGTTFNARYEIRTGTGKRKIIGGVRKVVRNSKGEPISMYGINWDCTKDVEADEKLAEQKFLLESVLDNIPNMVFVKDFQQNLRVTLMNKAGLALIGLPEERVVGTTVFDVHPKEQAEAFHRTDMDVFNQRSSIVTLKERIDTPTGTRYLRTYKVPTFNRQGDPHLLIAISTDITEELEMQAQLEVERAKSLHSAKLASLGEMSAGIAHEINNPLAIIDGSLRNLVKVKDDPTKFNAKIDVLSKSVSRISRIVNGLKKFARASGEVERLATKLTDIFDEVTILTEAKVKRHLTKIEVVVETQAKIACDVVEIEQVFVNLVNNGIDATKHLAERWIKIHAFEAADEIIVHVIDSGGGINPQIEQKLFQPFFTTKIVGEGTGLGLSITKGILDQHQASISINRDFKNTCFEVRFKKVTGVENAA